jgi:hypothetical protein
MGRGETHDKMGGGGYKTSFADIPSALREGLGYQPGRLRLTTQTTRVRHGGKTQDFGSTCFIAWERASAHSTSDVSAESARTAVV